MGVAVFFDDPQGPISSRDYFEWVPFDAPIAWSDATERAVILDDASRPPGGCTEAPPEGPGAVLVSLGGLSVFFVFLAFLSFGLLQAPNRSHGYL